MSRLLNALFFVSAALLLVAYLIPFKDVTIEIHPGGMTILYTLFASDFRTAWQAVVSIPAAGIAGFCLLSKRFQKVHRSQATYTLGLIVSFWIVAGSLRFLR